MRMENESRKKLLKLSSYFTTNELFGCFYDY